MKIRQQPAVETMPFWAADVLACPRCRSSLALEPDAMRCTNRECRYSEVAFPVVSGRPLLIDDDQSLFAWDQIRRRRIAPAIRENPGLPGSLRRFFSQRLVPSIRANFRTPENFDRFGRECMALSESPRVLLVGGGEGGMGISALREFRQLSCLHSDVYAGRSVHVIADGHQLPFADGSFEGVCIQAVLEHVLIPETVVCEIWRVLKENGVVYAETAFMQQVHEGRYDFHRFTLLGHRWLFRHFEEVDSGAACGTGMALIWSVKDFVASLTGSRHVGWLAASYALWWLKYADRFTLRRAISNDGASGVFFLGRRSEMPLTPRELIGLYRGGQG